eukprot:Phypoly_transcript_17617.p1 GENE.Phypoly_transcript_17617~~Phypoly_transcript_17617.p1  ORF type:complete len:241 (+),score=26.10 Phypoly_transcript_17617:110-724(+)
MNAAKEDVLINWQAPPLDIIGIGKMRQCIEFKDCNRWMYHNQSDLLDIYKKEMIPLPKRIFDNKVHFPEIFHACILVIPSDLPLDKVNKYIEARKLIQLTNTPVLHIFTKLDLPNAKANISVLKAKLDLGEHDTLEVTCYSVDHKKPDEEINSRALFALLWAIVIADSKGISINCERQLHKAQRIVKQLISSTTTQKDCTAVSE